MRIHHLNCMTFNVRVPSITHCLLIETTQGLVLVDTGLGLGDYEKPSIRMRAFLALNRVPRDADETALRQVANLGHSPRDVKQIVLTHLHLDHSGGLPDFPWAEVHVLASEHQAALHPKGATGWIGYDASHWVHGPRWVMHEPVADTWFGLPSSPVLGDVDRRILLIPLFGHSPGHCGVAIETVAGWLLHCGDAYERDVQIDPERPRSPFPKWAAAIDRALFPQEAIACLQMLMRDHGSQVKPFSSHDPITFAELRGELHSLQGVGQ